MISLIRSPLRVYLLLGTLALVGLYSGWKLPVSLFPNSSKVTVQVRIPLYSTTPSDFQNDYGYKIETQLRSINLKINKFTADYRFGDIRYKIDFDWEVDGDTALSKVKETMSSLSAPFPQPIRDNYWVNKWSENRTFVALSFFSDLRSTDEIYNLLSPALEPGLLSLKEVQNGELYNPQKKEITIELLPERLAQFGLLPETVQRALQQSSQEFQGGRIEFQEKKMQIFFDRTVKNLTDLRNFSFYTSTNQLVYLKDIADIKFGASESSRQLFRTSGAESLILFAEPKPGANVKSMSDEIVKIVDANKASWPEDIKFKYLVNPADFINSSIQHVATEVALAAILAVLVLFLFIGSLRNVVTAAVEIPLSIILAFIFMKLFNMNINLISLGGLALSAGMNVDASVVVIENIFRHFKLHPHLPKLDNILAALAEVYKPILVSTLASLIVFFPIIFTSGLTNSLLGDLAKAVIFSHGLSAIVALVLVPTVRLHLASWFEDQSESPFEKSLKKIEFAYERSLTYFIETPKLVLATTLLTSGLLLGLIFFSLPHLPKELIGKPETDWLMVFARSPQWQTISDFDSGHSQLDLQIREKYQDRLLYTFLQAGAGWGTLMLRLKDKNDLESLKASLEKDYPDTPDLKINTEVWNPAELSIPDPPHMIVHFLGPDEEENGRTAERFLNQLEDTHIFKTTDLYPSVSAQQGLFIETYLPQYDPQVLSQYINLSSQSQSLFRVRDEKSKNDIRAVLQFPKKYTRSLQTLKSMPFPHAGKIVPLSASGNFSFRTEPLGFYKEDGKQLFYVTGSVKDPTEKIEAQRKAFALFQKFEAELPPQTKTRVTFLNPDLETEEAIHQLLIAIGLSIVLIFLLMVLLFGTWIDSMLILLAIPFGILGALLSLVIFRSNLSLNSALGVILLNGIAVANSIILVDFIKELKSRGLSPRKAALEAAKARMRPILMTSMTTVLGMLPIALGMGSGGKILQPLGISVSGGLWVSMLFTLFFVPTLQTYYYEQVRGRK